MTPAQDKISNLGSRRRGRAEGILTDNPRNPPPSRLPGERGRTELPVAIEPNKQQVYALPRDDTVRRCISRAEGHQQLLRRMQASEGSEKSCDDASG